MDEEQTTLADLGLTRLQTEIMEDFCGNETVTMPGIGTPNPYWRLVDEPGRLGLLKRRQMQGDQIGYRLTKRGRQILARSC